MVLQCLYFRLLLIRLEVAECRHVVGRAVGQKESHATTGARSTGNVIKHDSVNQPIIAVSRHDDDDAQEWLVRQGVLRSGVRSRRCGFALRV